MRRDIRPRCECLDDRTLLSATAASTALGVSMATPPVATPADLRMTLTTDQSSYAEGQPVRMTLTETNITDQTVDLTVTPASGIFTVLQNGQAVWNSAGGLNAPLPQWVMEDPLAPGQSYTFQATWNGGSNIAPLSSPTGTFQVQAGERSLSSTFTVTPSPAPPSEPAPTTPVLVFAIMNAEPATASLGQPIHFVVKEYNTSLKDVIVQTGPAALRASISLDGVTVWRLPPLRGARPGQTVLHPGQVRQFVFTWNGRPNQKHVKLSPGTYLASATIDGHNAAALVQITA